MNNNAVFIAYFLALCIVWCALAGAAHEWGHLYRARLRGYKMGEIDYWCKRKAKRRIAGPLLKYESEERGIVLNVGINMLAGASVAEVPMEPEDLAFMLRGGPLWECLSYAVLLTSIFLLVHWGMTWLAPALLAGMIAATASCTMKFYESRKIPRSDYYRLRQLKKAVGE